MGLAWNGWLSGSETMLEASSHPGLRGVALPWAARGTLPWQGVSRDGVLDHARVPLEAKLDGGDGLLG